MVWPTKYGTAASQSVTPPEPPDRSDADAVVSIQSQVHSVVLTPLAKNLLPPTWASAPERNLDLEFSLSRAAGDEGIFYPSSTSPGNRQEALLQVHWPASAEKGKNNYISSVKIESRPIGATSWRSSATTIYWQPDTDPDGPEEAFLFAGVPTDEYRASASYTFTFDEAYSPVKRVTNTTTTVGGFQTLQAPLHSSLCRVSDEGGYSFSITVIENFTNERLQAPIDYQYIMQKPTDFYANFADPFYEEYQESFQVPTLSCNGNTTTRFAYAQFQT